MKKIRAETIRNFATLVRIGDNATTTDIANELGIDTCDVLNQLKRYMKAGYLTRGEVEEVRFDKTGRQVTRKMHTWTPTDKLKDYVDNVDAKERTRKTGVVANSIWQWGQV